MIALRYAVRSLRRSPGFVLVAILALGLGLGLTTTMFGVMDAALNPYIPYRDPATLVTLNWRVPRHVPLPNAELLTLLQARMPVFAAVEATAGRDVVLEARNGNRVAGLALVTPGYFAMLGVRPSSGRLLSAGDAGRAVVVSEELWRSLFGLRRRVAGTTLKLDGQVYDVVGVLPTGARSSADVWTTLSEAAIATHRFGNITARLRDGNTVESAHRALARLASQLNARFALTATRTGGRGVYGDGTISFSVWPLRQRSEEIRDIHFAMVGAAVVVLLIACVNLANLMLARGLAKRRELAVRLAVGASRAAVVRQMFLECAAITAAGCALGALLAMWGADVIASLMPPDIGRIGLIKPHLSWRVFAGSAICAILASLLFGLLPAIRIATDISLDEPLKDGAGTTGRMRGRFSALVVAEVALALVLLMAGGLLLRTVRESSRRQFVDQARFLLRANAAWRRTDSGVVRNDVHELLATVRSAEGVVAAAFIGNGAPRGAAVTAEMTTSDSTRLLTMRYYDVVSVDYLRTMALPVLRGRDFAEGDVFRPTRVAIIDPLAAEELYPRQNPVGRMVKLGAPTTSAPWVEIIGVARNPAVLEGPQVFPQPTVWVLEPSTTARGVIVARAATTDLAPVEIALSRQLRQLPGVFTIFVEPYTYRRDAWLAMQRFLAGVFVAMGTAALALAALGLYGVLAYTVSQRMREFAVRVALGARAAQLRRAVLRDAITMLLAGIGIGAFAALAAMRTVDSVLSGVYRTDVVSLVSAEALLMVVGIVAVLGPARRAARANPLDIMRAV